MLDYKLWITHLHLQSTRKKTNEDLLKFGEILDTLLSLLHENDSVYLPLLFKLIAYTRDIHGMGERDLTYMMIFIWYKHFPSYALRALHLFYSVGSWKDFKYFCKWIRDHSNMDHPLIDECIKIMNEQFNMDRQCKTYSMVAKWMPRESSAFSWLFTKMFSHRTNYLNIKQYRTEISRLNRILDTPQIKQCENKWSTIIPEKVSMVTKNKQCLAFLNANAVPGTDREKCKTNFQSYLQKNGAILSFSMTEWVKDVFSLQYKPSMIKKKKLISTWNSLYRSLPKTGNVIPVVDLSISNRDEIIGLVLMIMEKSFLNNRMLLFDLFPYWLSFQNVSIIDKIEYFKRTTKDKGIGSDIYRAVDLIIDTCLKTLDPLLIEDMVFVVFSDHFSHPEIMDRFQRAGILSPPHFIYWKTSPQIDALIEPYVNATFFSGDSSSLLFTLGQLFMDSETIFHPIQKLTSYEVLCNSLSRYDFHHK